MHPGLQSTLFGVTEGVAFSLGSNFYHVGINWHASWVSFKAIHMDGLFFNNSCYFFIERLSLGWGWIGFITVFLPLSCCQGVVIHVTCLLFCMVGNTKMMKNIVCDNYAACLSRICRWMVCILVKGFVREVVLHKGVANFEVWTVVWSECGRVPFVRSRSSHVDGISLNPMLLLVTIKLHILGGSKFNHEGAGGSGLLHVEYAFFFGWTICQDYFLVFLLAMLVSTVASTIMFGGIVLVSFGFVFSFLFVFLWRFVPLDFFSWP